MLNRLYSYFFNKSGQVRKSFINEEGQSPWRTKVFSIFHLFVLEIFTVILKFTVLLVKPSYESFQLFTNQYTLPVCQYSYFDHKKFQKKIRLFSLAGMSTIISATIIINLVLSLFLPDKYPVMQGQSIARPATPIYGMIGVYPRPLPATLRQPAVPHPSVLNRPARLEFPAQGPVQPFN